MIKWSSQGYIVTILVAGVVGTHIIPQCPRHRGLPDGFSRTENKFRERALFRLDLRSAIQGYLPEKEYRFRVQTTARKFKFNDATVSIGAVNQNCGAGTWMSEADGLYSPRDCPSIVTTQQKEPMGRAYFKWRAPACGCVHFRVRVHVNGTYYLEDEDVFNGPLARTICLHASAVTSPPTDITSATTLKAALPKVLTRNERLQLLCNVTEDHDVDDVMNNEDFMSKRMVSKMSSFEMERLNIAVERRHVEILNCCKLTKEYNRNECFGDVRRIRIDTFCGNGEPDIPLTKTRYDWIKQKQSECCPEIGESRYKCFNHSLYDGDMVKDGPDHHASIDMDDFDPVNYVEDYPRAEEIRQKFSKRLEQTTTADDDKGQAESKNNVVQHKKEAESHVETTTPMLTKGAGDDNDGDVDNNLYHKHNKNLKQHPINSKENEDDDDDDDDDVDDDDENGHAEVEKLNDASDKDDAKNRYLSLEECCMNGIDAGTRVAAEGFGGCFKMADRFDSFFTKWTRRCDRHFVICCMRVIDGEINAVSKYIHLRRRNLLLLREYTPNNGDQVVKEVKTHINNKSSITSKFEPNLLNYQNTTSLQQLQLTNKNLIIRLNGKKHLTHPVIMKETMRLRKRYNRKYRKLRELQKLTNKVNSQNHTHKTIRTGYG